MRLPLKIRGDAPLKLFTTAQLSELAASLAVELPCETKVVSFSKFPPPDTNLPWQQLDCSGVPIGTIKQFTGGEWK